MTTPLRIGILGTHSTGKTTLMRRIEMELLSEGITVTRTGGLAKRAAATGFPKMTHHTATSTEWIITQGIADELAGSVHADVVLADRAPYDAIAYYTAALELREEPSDPLALERLNLLAATQAPQYDLLLATVLDPEAPVSAGHDYDLAYRGLVDRHVHQLLKNQELHHVPVTNDDTARDNAIRLSRATAGLPAGAA